MVDEFSDNIQRCASCEGGRPNGTSSVPRPGRFVPFDDQKAMRIYRRNLPHWRQDGRTYFVTFRLVDSIPDGVRREWEYEQTMWLQARGIRYDGARGLWRTKFDELAMHERGRFEAHFNRKVQACLDRGLGACWLKQAHCIDALRRELFRADGERHHLADFVIMPNHVHILTTPIAGHELEMILKAIKGKAAIECNKHLRRSGTFWQSESHDHIVRDLAQLQAYREYIAGNPASAGLELHGAAIHHAVWMTSWIEVPP